MKSNKFYLLFAGIAIIALIWIIGSHGYSLYIKGNQPKPIESTTLTNFDGDKLYGNVGIESVSTTTEIVTEPISTDPPPITQRRETKSQPIDKKHPLYNTDMGFFLTYEYATTSPSIRIKDKDTHRWLGTKFEGLGSNNAEAALDEVADYANTIPDNIVWEDGWYVEPFTSMGTPVLIQKFGDHRGNHYSTLTVSDDYIGGFYVEHWR